MMSEGRTQLRRTENQVPKQSHLEEARLALDVADRRADDSQSYIDPAVGMKRQSVEYQRAQAYALVDIAENLRHLVQQNNAGCDGDLRRRVQVLEKKVAPSEYWPGLDEEQERA